MNVYCANYRSYVRNNAKAIYSFLKFNFHDEWRRRDSMRTEQLPYTNGAF